MGSAQAAWAARSSHHTNPDFNTLTKYTETERIRSIPESFYTGGRHSPPRWQLCPWLRAAFTFFMTDTLQPSAAPIPQDKAVSEALKGSLPALGSSENIKRQKSKLILAQINSQALKNPKFKSIANSTHILYIYRRKAVQINALILNYFLCRSEEKLNKFLKKSESMYTTTEHSSENFKIL